MKVICGRSDCDYYTRGNCNLGTICIGSDMTCQQYIGKDRKFEPNTEAQKIVDTVKKGKLPPLGKSNFGIQPLDQNIFQPIPMKDVTWPY